MVHACSDVGGIQENVRERHVVEGALADGGDLTVNVRTDPRHRRFRHPESQPSLDESINLPRRRTRHVRGHNHTPQGQSTLRRGSSRSQKLLPLQSLGIFTSTSPPGSTPSSTVSRCAPQSAPKRLAPSQAITSPPRSAPAARPARPSTAHPSTPASHRLRQARPQQTSFGRAIVGLLPSSRKNSPRFPRWPALCQPPPQKPSTSETPTGNQFLLPRTK